MYIKSHSLSLSDLHGIPEDPCPFAVHLHLTPCFPCCPLSARGIPPFIYRAQAAAEAVAGNGRLPSANIIIPCGSKIRRCPVRLLPAKLNYCYLRRESEGNFRRLNSPTGQPSSSPPSSSSSPPSSGTGGPCCCQP